MRDWIQVKYFLSLSLAILIDSIYTYVTPLCTINVLRRNSNIINKWEISK